MEKIEGYSWIRTLEQTLVITNALEFVLFLPRIFFNIEMYTRVPNCEIQKFGFFVEFLNLRTINQSTLDKKVLLFILGRFSINENKNNFGHVKYI